MATLIEEKQNTKIDDFQKIKVRNNFFYSLIKRIFDIVSSGLALIILFIPLGIICMMKAYEDFKTPYWKLVIKEANENTPKNKIPSGDTLYGYLRSSSIFMPKI